MPFKEKCPVCRIGWRVRPDVKTCSRQCSKEWANWSPEQRAKASQMTTQPSEVESLVEKAIEELKGGMGMAEDPYPEPVDGDDPAAFHIMKILGGNKE